MFSIFDEETRKILLNAKKEKNKLNHFYIGTEHLFLSLLLSENEIKNQFNKKGIYYENYKKKVIEIIGNDKTNNNDYSDIYTPLFKRILEDSILISKENRENKINIRTIINELIENNEGFGIDILYDLGLNIEDLNELKQNENLNIKKNNKKLLVEEFGFNLNKKAKNGDFDPVIGREKEIMEIIEVLCRKNKNNPLLIGEAGVGKTAIIEELAKRIEEKRVPNKLFDKKIISVSISSLVSGTKYRGEFEERINKILCELEEKNNLVLFIDEIHTIVGAGGAEGAIDASNILKPYMARGKIKIIGATTIDEYKKYIEDDKALDRRFQIIKINEPGYEETLNILINIKNTYEKYHNVIIQDEIIKKLLILTNKYIIDGKQPDKSINILDEVCAKVSIKESKKIKEINLLKQELNKIKKEKNEYVISNKFNDAYKLKEKENIINNKINKLEKTIKEYNENIVKEKDVEKIIEQKTGISINEIEGKIDFCKIEKKLLKDVIGQKVIINEVIDELKSANANDNKPKSFLFEGSTGVGKTFLARQLAKYLNKKIVRLNMNEYKEPHSISKIIGSPPGYVGYSDKNTVLNQIEKESTGIILLDEFEKAHDDIKNLFLQALDEGIIISSTNKEISLANYIFIITCNNENNSNYIGYDKNIIKKHNNSNEINGRIDKIMKFNNMNKEDIKRIIIKQYEEISNKNGLPQKITKSELKKIIEESEYLKYGARKIKNIVYKHINKEKKTKKVKITMESI